MMKHAARALLPMLALLQLSACGSPVPPGQQLARIEIDTGGFLLAGAGATKTLSATAYSSTGAVMHDVEISWHSSDAAAVSTSTDGTVTAVAAAGSAQITARSGSVVSAPVVAVAAALAPGAVTVSDSQLTAEVAAVDPLAPFGVGFQYTIGLAGIGGIDVGDIVVGSERAPIAGRVVAIGAGQVTLEMLPLGEVFVDLDLGEQTFDLSRSAARLSSETAGHFDVGRSADGGYVFELKGPVSGGMGVAEAAPAASLQGGQQFQAGPFTCSAEEPGASLNVSEARFSLTPDLALEVAWTESLQRLVVVAEPAVGFELLAQLDAPFSGEVTCRLRLLEPVVDLPGALGIYLGGMIPLGVGFSIAGELPVEDTGIEVTGQFRPSLTAGFNCTEGGCSTPQDAQVGDGALKVRPVAPFPPDGVRVELEAWAFATLSLELGMASGMTGPPADAPPATQERYTAELLGLRAGTVVEADLASEGSQASNASTTSGYQLSFLAIASAGSGLGEAMDLLGMRELEPDFQVGPQPLGESPRATAFTVGSQDFAVGDEVEFTVTLDPATVSLLGEHNIHTVRVHRLVGNSLTFLAEAAPAPGQHSVQVRWTATEGSQGGMSFVAFVHAGPTAMLPGFLAGKASVGVASAYIGQITATYDYERLEEQWYYMDNGGTTEDSESVGLWTQSVTYIIDVELELIGGDWVFNVILQQNTGQYAGTFSRTINYFRAHDQCATLIIVIGTAQYDGSNFEQSSIILNSAHSFLHIAGVPIDMPGTSYDLYRDACLDIDIERTSDEPSGAFHEFYFPLLMDPSDPTTMIGQYDDPTEDLQISNLPNSYSLRRERVNESVSWHLVPRD